MVTFPATRIERFQKEYWPLVKGSMRYGQAFHTYLGLEKLSTDKEWLDRLYQSDGETARKMIEERTDFHN